MIQAIKGVSFHVDEGEIIALIGANGAGKTTITSHYNRACLWQLRAVLNTKAATLRKYRRIKSYPMGMSHVPEGRRIFQELSVYDNLLLGAFTRRQKSEISESIERIYLYVYLLRSARIR